MKGLDCFIIYVLFILKIGSIKFGGLNFGRYKMREVCISKFKFIVLLNKLDKIF